MKLHIDTSSNQKTIIRLGNTELVEDSSVWRSQVLLPMIDELLKKEGKMVGEIREIRVVEGTGSFTGLRVGVAVANALGYALKIPVNGKRPDKLEIVEPKYE